MISLSYLFELEKIWAERLRSKGTEIKNHPNYTKLQDVANYNHLSNSTQLFHMSDNISKSIGAKKLMDLADKKREQASHLANAVDYQNEKKELKPKRFLDKIINKTTNMIADPLSKNTVCGQLDLAKRASKSAREIKSNITSPPTPFQVAKLLSKNFKQSTVKSRIKK